MSTPITFTGDVGRVAVATNDIATITWYVYERPFNTGTTLYVQRETNAGLESEVRLLAEGERPEIFFDFEDRIWIILYTLNEKLYMITADEFDVPTTLSSQTGTTIDCYSSVVANQSTDETMHEIVSQIIIGNQNLDIDDSYGVDSVSVGANEGGNWQIRWRALTSSSTRDNIHVAGFNIYVQRYSDRALIRLNPVMIPFQGFDPFIYSYEIAPIRGKFYVTQVNFRGNANDSLVEGRIKPPSDEIYQDVLSNSSRIGRFFGDTIGDLSFTIVDTSPVISITNDSLRQTGFGDTISNLSEIITSNIVEFDTVQIVSGASQPIEDFYTQQGFGQGIFLFISGSGFGSVIVG